MLVTDPSLTAFSARRGTVHGNGLIHICDWYVVACCLLYGIPQKDAFAQFFGVRYATFSALAGVDPFDNKAANFSGIPAIDSINMWPAISTGTQTPRNTIVLSASGGGNGSSTFQCDALMLRFLLCARVCEEGAD